MICGENDEFILQVRQALRDHAPRAIAARVAMAQENGWNQWPVEIHRVLQHRLAGAEE